MKILFNIVLVFLMTAFAQANDTKIVTISEVVTRVSNNNFKVYENALKVYQAQSNIQKARADLLPKLNLWSVAGMILDPTSIVEKTPEVAPFLVPGNWFRLEETKLLYLAEREGYRALWSNEVFIAKTLYKSVLFDERILGHVRSSIKELQKIHKIIKTRETFGGAELGTSREVEIKILGLLEDEQNIQVLLAKEYDELTYALGFPTDEDIQFAPVETLFVEDLKPVNPKDYEFRVLSTSPERRQFEHFLSVLGQIKKEIQYSFLGVSEVSRGTAGGIFDSMPIPAGAGLSTRHAMKIVDTQKEIMKTQRTGVEETLKRQLRNVTTQYNLDLTNYSNFKKRSELSKDSKNSMIRRLQLGENLNVLSLSEATRNQIQAETALSAVQYRVMTSIDRIQRLTFEGDYSMTPPLINSLKGVQ